MKPRPLSPTSKPRKPSVRIVERDAVERGAKPAPHSASLFSRFARSFAHATGHPGVFVLAAAIVLVWLVTGPMFHFSEAWQLVINTTTTIITFLMVFLIQHTQNRDSEAMHLKLDELVRAVEGAQNSLLDVEEVDQRELDAMKHRYATIAQDAREGAGLGEGP